MECDFFFLFFINVNHLYLFAKKAGCAFNRERERECVCVFNRINMVIYFDHYEIIFFIFKLK